MEINEQTYEQFDRYLSGKMDAAEKLAFEKMLAENPALREELSWMESAVNDMKQFGKTELQQQLKSIGASIPASAFGKYSPSLKPKNGFNWAKWWWVIAAAAVAAAAVTWYIFHHQKTNPSDGEAGADIAVQNDVPKFPAKDSALSDSTNISSDCNTSQVNVINRYGAVFYDADTNDYSELSVQAGQNQHALSVTLCVNEGTAPVYEYGDGLKIQHLFSKTDNLRFYGHGDTLWISDGKPGWYLLTKGGGVKPMKRMQENAAGGKKPKENAKVKKEAMKCPDTIRVMSNEIADTFSRLIKSSRSGVRK